MDEIECSGRRNFLGLPDEYSSRAGSYFHVVPVPYDATSTYMSGSRFGPRAIIDSSFNLEMYDHDLCIEAARAGIATWPEVPIMAGDPALMLAEIEGSVREIVREGKLPILLGGEHTVALASVSVLARDSESMVVSFDAHADLRDSYQGTRLSHACFLRRAAELARCCAFGVRSLSREEALYLDRSDVRVTFADKLIKGGVESVDLDFIPENVYLSIDVDFLDPSVVPATGTPEPGGLGWYEATTLLERIITGRRVLGFDVVELCPQPGNPAPDFTVAKLLYRVIGLVVKFSKNRRDEWIGHGKEKDQEEAR